MRKAVTTTLALAVAVLAVPTAAQAREIDCPSGGGTCTGTSRGDEILGSDKPDTIFAKAGNDQVIERKPTCDPICPTRDDDEIHGGRGNDWIADGSAPCDENVIEAGKGDDTINVREGEVNPLQPGCGGSGVDTVNCGSGKDTVQADENDVTINCEHVSRA